MIDPTKALAELRAQLGEGLYQRAGQVRPNASITRMHF
jgi:hypothetical protein